MKIDPVSIMVASFFELHPKRMVRNSNAATMSNGGIHDVTITPSLTSIHNGRGDRGHQTFTNNRVLWFQLTQIAKDANHGDGSTEQLAILQNICLCPPSTNEMHYMLHIITVSFCATIRHVFPMLLGMEPAIWFPYKDFFQLWDADSKDGIVLYLD